MPNPRKEFVDWLGKHDPAAIEQLVVNLAACSETSFAEVCDLAAKLAQAADVKGACEAARIEVEKRPKKEAPAIDETADVQPK